MIEAEGAVLAVVVVLVPNCVVDAMPPEVDVVVGDCMLVIDTGPPEAVGVMVAMPAEVVVVVVVGWVVVVYAEPLEVVMVVEDWAVVVANPPTVVVDAEPLEVVVIVGD